MHQSTQVESSSIEIVSVKTMKRNQHQPVSLFFSISYELGQSLMLFG